MSVYEAPHMSNLRLCFTRVRKHPTVELKNSGPKVSPYITHENVSPLIPPLMCVCVYNKTKRSLKKGNLYLKVTTKKGLGGPHFVKATTGSMTHPLSCRHWMPYLKLII